MGAPTPPSDDELFEACWALADELDVLPQAELRARMGAVLGALAALRLWLAANAWEPGRPRKPTSLVQCFVVVTRRLQETAARSEMVGLMLHDDDLLPGEKDGSWMALYPLDPPRT